MNTLLKGYNGKPFFWSGDYLKPHMWIHTGYKPYCVFEVCGGECFARAANLKIQKRTQTPSKVYDILPPWRKVLESEAWSVKWTHTGHK